MMDNIDGGTCIEHIQSSITGELREYAMGWRDRSCHEHLLAIADRIDEQVSKMYADLTIGMEPMTDESMAENGWIKLPVDADGAPIHIGDRLDGYGQMHRVCQLKLYTGEDWSLVDERGDVYYDMAGFAHVQPDSWERIVEDAMDWDADGWECTRADAVSDLVARCERLAR